MVLGGEKGPRRYMYTASIHGDCGGGERWGVGEGREGKGSFKASDRWDLTSVFFGAGLKRDTHFPKLSCVY